MTHTHSSPLREASFTLRTGLWAGLAGASVEALWIVTYSAVAGSHAATVARGVTATVLPALAGGSISVALGLAIHFCLAIVLGLAVAVAVRQGVPQLAGTMAEAGLIVAALAVVWAVNFLIVLPIVNPDFIHVVPLPVSLASKLLFGAASALVLHYATDRNVRPGRS